MKLLPSSPEVQNKISLNDNFDQIYRSFYHPLCFYARKLVNSSAEDVIESLFVKLWERKQSFNDTEHLKSFLYRATRNACLDYIKINKKHDDMECVEDLEIGEDDHVFLLIRSETYAEIYRAVQGLPRQCRKIIELSFFEEKTNQEIAELLQLSDQTVKNHKVKGLKILKTKLPSHLFLLLSSIL